MRTGGGNGHRLCALIFDIFLTDFSSSLTSCLGRKIFPHCTDGDFCMLVDFPVTIITLYAFSLKGIPSNTEHSLLHTGQLSSSVSIGQTPLDSDGHFTEIQKIQNLD